MEQFHFTDPTYFDMERVIFDIPIRLNEAISPQMMLTNLGALCEVTAGNPYKQTCKYPANLGVKSCVRNASIRFNDQYPQELREFNHVLGLMNLATNNGKALDIDSELEKSRRAYHLVNHHLSGDDFAALGYMDYTISPNLTVARDNINDMTVFGNSGIVSLVDFFDILNKFQQNRMMIYSKYLFIRIEIEFETDINMYSVQWSPTDPDYELDQGGLTNSQLSFYRPVLITKRTSDPGVLQFLESEYKKGFSIPYSTWTTEIVNLGEVTDGGYADMMPPNNFTLKAVQGKSLALAVVQTTFDVNPLSFLNAFQPELGQFYSIGNNLENLKIQLNGTQFIPYDGIDNPALKRLYRDLTLRTALQLVGGSDSGFTNDQSTTTHPLFVKQLDSQGRIQSYYAIPFGGTRINDLNCIYQCAESRQIDTACTQTQRWHFNTLHSCNIVGSTVVLADM